MTCPGPGREEKHPRGCRTLHRGQCDHTAQGCLNVPALLCFTQDCYRTGEKWCKSLKTLRQSMALARPAEDGAHQAAAPSCHSSDPHDTGGATGGLCLWHPLVQELGGGKPMPCDGSCSYGRGLHRAHGNHIFSQIKCSSVVKFEHIPGTQDEAQPLFPLYLPNCFKDRILK